jgi:hypothetical protein
LPDVKATYIEEITGVYTDMTPVGPEYALVTAMFTGDEGVGQLRTKKKRLEHVLVRQGYNKSEAVRLVDRFRRVQLTIA